MATLDTKAPAPPPPPPAPKVSVVDKARAEIAKGKTGFDPMRPFRYTAAFINGTVSATLDGVAKWGRLGLKWGGALWFAAWMTPALLATFGMAMPAAGSLAATVLTAAGGTAMLGGMYVGAAALAGVVIFVGGALAVGAALGGAYGLLTGGAKAVSREHRRDKYAEDLVQRSAIRKRTPHPRADYREAARQRDARDDFMTNFTLAREAEIANDANTYWQDRESGIRSDMGRGH